MGKCIVSIEQVRFYANDPTQTLVYVKTRVEGDCPYQLPGWHYKAFPAGVDALAILQKHFREDLDYNDWEQREPPQDTLDEAKQSNLAALNQIIWGAVGCVLLFSLVYASCTAHP